MIRPNSAYVEEDNRDLERRVLNYLNGRHMQSLRKIQVQAQEGKVVLQGEVQSFYEKQLCLNCCRRVEGVHELVDKVDVVTREPEAWFV